MKKIKLLPILLLICLLTSALAPSALALDDPGTSSQYIVLADGDTGKVYYSKNADAKAYPASLTKIMTVLLAVEAIESGEHSADEMVTASENCMWGMDEASSTSGIVAGEIMSLKNLIYCSMLGSANEACNIIAEYLSGSIGDFVARMNERAAELGCAGTNFVNPHGMPDGNHYTTASDMLVITREALSHEMFASVCAAVKYTVPSTNYSPERKLSNTNGLINAESEFYPGYYYEYATGVKTGHTTDAGYCLASSAKKEDISLIAIVLGGTARDRGDGVYTYSNFTDSITMYKWVFTNFSRQELLSSSELVAEIPIELGADADTVTLRPAETISALVPNDTTAASYERTVTVYSEQTGETLKAPIDAGTELGEIVVSKDGVVYGSTKLVASTGVDLARWEFIKLRIKAVTDKLWVKLILWALVLGVAGYIALVVSYRKRHRRHQAEVRRRAEERRRREEQEKARRAARERELDSAFRVPYDEQDGYPAQGESRERERDYFDDYFGDDKGKW